jgi:hypothetical protein
VQRCLRKVASGQRAERVPVGHAEEADGADQHANINPIEVGTERTFLLPAPQDKKPGELPSAWDILAQAEYVLGIVALLNGHQSVIVAPYAPGTRSTPSSDMKFT